MHRLIAVETLDPRYLLATLSGGLLTIDGTSRADIVVLSYARDNTLRVENTGVTRRFLLDRITAIVVNLGRGDDTFIGQGIAIPMTLRGGAGNDHIYAGDARDVVYGDVGNDTLWGAGDRDTLWGEAGDDAIAGGGSNDIAVGDDGNDRIDGGRGNDVLSGGGGVDRLNGELGNDTLTGGGARDWLWGGFGFDTFADYEFGRDRSDYAAGDIVPPVDPKPAPQPDPEPDPTPGPDPVNPPPPDPQPEDPTPGTIYLEQPTASMHADLPTFFGQSFRTAQSVTLKALRLHVNTSAGGTGVTVRLHSGGPATYSPAAPIAVGHAPEAAFSTTEHWVTIAFDTPVTLVANQNYLFTVTADDYQGGIEYGWNNYGVATTDVYASGRYFDQYTELFPNPQDSTNLKDVAFQLIS